MLERLGGAALLRNAKHHFSSVVKCHRIQIEIVRMEKELKKLKWEERGGKRQGGR